MVSLSSVEVDQSRRHGHDLGHNTRTALQQRFDSIRERLASLQTCEQMNQELQQCTQELQHLHMQIAQQDLLHQRRQQLSDGTGAGYSVYVPATRTMAEAGVSEEDCCIPPRMSQMDHDCAYYDGDEIFDEFDEQSGRRYSEAECSAQGMVATLHSSANQPRQTSVFESQDSGHLVMTLDAFRQSRRDLQVLHHQTLSDADAVGDEVDRLQRFLARMEHPEGEGCVPCSAEEIAPLRDVFARACSTLATLHQRRAEIERKMDVLEDALQNHLQQQGLRHQSRANRLQHLQEVVQGMLRDLHLRTALERELQVITAELHRGNTV